MSTIETNPDTGDPYSQADASLNQLVPGYSSATTQLRLQGARLKILTSNNPVLASNIGLASQIANTPIDDYQLSQQALALSGVTQMGTMMQSLSTQSALQQRTSFAHLTPAQQQALQQLGYRVPDAPSSGGGGFFSELGHLAGEGIGAITHVAREVGGPALDIAGEIGSIPAHVYRAVRTSEPWIQGIAAAGAMVGAILLAPETGGASLGLAATLGGFFSGGVGAVAGAAAAAGTASTLYGALHGNNTLWIDTWNQSKDGERVFTKGSQKRANALIGNDLSVQALARDLAFESPYQLTTEIAGTRNSTEKDVLDNSIQRLVASKFPLGSPQFQDAYQRMLALRQDPKFMGALRELQDGKISFGRDLARGIGLAPGSSPYTLLSGAADATFMMKTDPLLQLGRTAKAYQAWRYGMGSITSAATLESRLASEPVQRAMGTMAEAIKTQNPELIRRAGLSVDYPELIAFDLHHPVRTAADVAEFYKTSRGFASLLEGQAGSWGGTGLQLPHVTIPRMTFNQVRAKLGDVINFADDRNVIRMVNKATEGRSGFGILKPFDQMAGILKSLSTKIPTNPFVNLTESSSLREVHQLVELGRFMGMSSAERTAAYNMIMSGPSLGARVFAVRQFYSRMFEAVGTGLTEDGRETMSKFLTSFSQKYSGITEAAINAGGLEMSTGLHSYQLSNALAVPDLQALRQAVNRSVFSKAMGLTDMPWIASSMGKVWKPLTLMRVGFIPRVAGDEVAGFIARRGWKAYLNTFGPRAVADVDRAVMSPLASFDRLYGATFGHLPLVGDPSKAWIHETLASWSDWTRGVLTSPQEGGGLIKHLPGFNGLPAPLQRAIIGAPDALRYQWLHGNDPDVIAAARKFHELWGSSRVRMLSAAHFEALSGVPAPQYLMQINAQGVESSVAALPLGDMWGMIAKGDPFFTHWGYSSISKWALGEEGATIIKHLSTYASPSVVESGVDENLLTIIRDQVGPERARLVANILGNVDRRYIEHELVRIPEVATLGKVARAKKVAEVRNMSQAELVKEFVPDVASTLNVQARGYVSKHLANWVHLGEVPEFLTEHGELERRILADLSDMKLRTENSNPARSFRSIQGSESEQPVLYPVPTGIARMYSPALDAGTLQVLRNDPELKQKILDLLRSGGSGDPNVNAILAHLVSGNLTGHFDQLVTAAQLNNLATVGLSAASLNDYRTAETLSRTLHSLAGVDRAKVAFYDLPENFRYYGALPQEQLLGRGVRMRSVDPIYSQPRMHVLDRGGYEVPGGLTAGGIDHVEAAEEWARQQWRDVQMRVGVGSEFQEGMGSFNQLPGEYLHEGIAPTAMEVWDAEDGISALHFENGAPIPRLTMSAVSDMTHRLPPSVPGREMRVFAGDGKWADFKTNVFKRMGATIDAIARKPIAFDRFLNAYRTNMANFSGLMNPELWDQNAPITKMAFNVGDADPRHLAEEFSQLSVKLKKTGAAWEDVRDALPVWMQPAVTSGRDVAVLRAVAGDVERTQELVIQLAQERTIKEVMPFIHEPAIRSQFQEYTRNIFPFFFAQEQFMRRWAGTLLTSPEALRGAQLLMGGMRSIGMIHSDGNGKDMFWIPGSGLLTSMLGKIPGIGSYIGNQGLGQFTGMAEGAISGLNPGLGHEFGSPSAGPLLSIPLDAITKQFPDLLPIDKALTGGFGTNRTVLQTLMPTPLARFYRAFFGSESDQQYASAMVSVAQILEANGNGLEENATVEQQEEYLDRLRGQTRNMVLMQAIVGFISPASPRAEVAPDDLSLGDHLGVGTIRTLQAFRSEYGTLVRNLGIEKGHQEFVRRYPDSNLTEYPGIVDPNALTVAHSHSRGLAHVPATQVAFDYYHAHSSFLDDARNAAGWFLPPGKDAEEAAKFDLSVYQDQIAVGLRVRQAPQDFVTALKFASGAGPYFQSQQNYQDTLATLTDPQMRLQLTNEYNAWKAGFLARRPIFANEIASAAGAQRRQQTIAEMRQLVYVNPETQKGAVPVDQRPWHFKGLKDLQDGFDNFTATLGQINSSRSKVAQEAAKQLKLQFEDWATSYIDRHPEVASYWTGVLAPEANLG